MQAVQVVVHVKENPRRKTGVRGTRLPPACIPPAALKRYINANGMWPLAMRRTLVIVGILVCCFSSARIATADDEAWKKHTVRAMPDATFNAALKVISQHHEIRESNKGLHIIRFHVGTTAWSWGYNVTASIEPFGSDSAEITVSIEKSGGPALSWGSGKKEVGKIFKWIDQELSKSDKPADKNKK